MACLNENCRYAQYCHNNVKGYENHWECPYYWKLDEIAMDVEHDHDDEDYEDIEEEDDK